MDLILACIRSASYSTLVEGSVTTIISPHRGIRQGDPMSMLLFIVVLEYLLHLTEEAVAKKKLELYVMGRARIESHVAFANDISFNCRASHWSFDALQSILIEFCSFSGLTINQGKSFVLLSAKIHDGDILAGKLGFPMNALPIKYLGVPVIGKSISHKVYDFLIYIAYLQSFLERWS